jgi:membrane associated rhomboid family serine protease
LFPLKDNIPTDRFPVVTVALIVANVLMYFLFQKGGLSLGDPGSDEYVCNVLGYGAIPAEFTGGGQVLPDDALEVCGRDELQNPVWLTAFSSMFMHGGLLHLGGNMLFLWIFGNNVEDSMGRAKYVVFYLLGGLAALGAQIAVGPDSEIPTIGASGAVAAVLGGYLLLFPRARVVTVIFIVFFFTIIEIPALIMLGLWFVQQVVFGSLDFTSPTGDGGGVAYFAHIGGFVFGLALIKVFATRKRDVDRPLF